MIIVESFRFKLIVNDYLPFNLREILILAFVNRGLTCSIN